MSDITQSISSYPGAEAPDKDTQTPSEFSNYADQLGQKMTEWPEEYNQFADEANSLKVDVNSLKGETQTIKDNAVSETGILKTAAEAAAIDASDSASEADNYEDGAQVAASSAATQAANVGSMLGINFGGWTIENGELIVTHLSTTTPSIVDGELSLIYETL